MNRRTSIKIHVTRWEIILGSSAHILFWVANIVQREFKKTEENRAEKVSKFGASGEPKTPRLDGELDPR